MLETMKLGGKGIAATAKGLYNVFTGGMSSKVGDKIVNRLDAWSMESDTTKITNLAMQSKWLSTKSIVDASPNAAPDEIGIGRNVLEEHLGQRSILHDLWIERHVINLCLACSKNSEFCSIIIQRLSSCLATSPVVPEPPNGSRIKSPLLLQLKMCPSGNERGKAAGWAISP